MMLSTHDVALALQTDEKTTRRFLRTILPHQEGQRWQIEEDELERIRLLWVIKKLGKDHQLDLFIRSTNDRKAHDSGDQEPPRDVPEADPQ